MRAEPDWPYPEQPRPTPDRRAIQPQSPPAQPYATSLRAPALRRPRQRCPTSRPDPRRHTPGLRRHAWPPRHRAWLAPAAQPRPDNPCHTGLRPTPTTRTPSAPCAPSPTCPDFSCLGKPSPTCLPSSSRPRPQPAPTFSWPTAPHRPGPTLARPTSRRPRPPRSPTPQCCPRPTGLAPSATRLTASRLVSSPARQPPPTPGVPGLQASPCPTDVCAAKLTEPTRRSGPTTDPATATRLAIPRHPRHARPTPGDSSPHG